MKQPKFKVGQVVGVRQYPGMFLQVAEIYNSDPRRPFYRLKRWDISQAEAALRPLTKKEIANGT